MQVKKKYIVIIGAVLTILIGAGLLTSRAEQIKGRLTYQGPLFNFSSSIVYALRDIADLTYIFNLAGKSTLPRYDITISPDHQAQLDAALAQVGDDRYLSDDLRIQVPVTFQYNGDIYDAKISYRGTQDIHWNADKKSYSVRFDKKSLFEGRRKLNLILPLDRKYFVEALNMYRAEKMGFFVPEITFVNVFVNGKRQGVYVAQEGWSDEWLTFEEKSTDGALYKTRDIRHEFCSDPDDYYDCLREYASLWELAAGKSDLHDELADLRPLLDAFLIEDEAEFQTRIEDLIDVDQWLTWNVHYLLVQSYHQGRSNLRFYWNPDSAQYDVIPWDVGLDMNHKHPGVPSLQDQIDVKYNPFVDRLLSIPEYRYRRDVMLWDYISNDNAIADDFAYYDSLYENTKRDFYKDRPKRKSNRSFDRDVKTYRDQMMSYIDNLIMIFGDNGTYLHEIQASAGEGTVRIDIGLDSITTHVLTRLELQVDESRGLWTLHEDVDADGVLSSADRLIETTRSRADRVVFGTLGDPILVSYDLQQGRVDPITHKTYLISTDHSFNVQDRAFTIMNAHSHVEAQDVSGMEQ
jgi:spore coat protein H